MIRPIPQAVRPVPAPAVVTTPARATASAVAQLAEISVSAPLTTVAWKVAAVTAVAFPARGAAVAVIGPGKTVGLEFSAGGLAATLDERQFGPGYGPALDSARHGRAVVVDGASGRSHDDFRRLAARQGVQRVRSWPLMSADRSTSTGSLSVYDAEVRPMTGTEREQFSVFLAAAAVLVADAVRYTAAVQTAEQLQEAMKSRASIEQAKGIIMAHHRCSSEEAFERLKSLSSATNQKLRAVAVAIVQDATS